MPDEVKDEKDERNVEDESVEEEIDDDKESDDEESEPEFSSHLLTRARYAGVDADEFDNEDDLVEAVEEAIVRLKNSGGKGASPSNHADGEGESDDLTMEEIEIALKDEDIDPSIVAELRKLNQVTQKNLRKLAERIKGRGDSGDAKMAGQVQALARQVGQLNAQNVAYRLDAWIADNDDVKAYLGEGPCHRMDNDSKEARRRRSLVKRADRLAATMTERDFKMEDAFEAAFALMRKAKSSAARKVTAKKGATRTVRASGSSSSELGGKSSHNEDQGKREAASFVREWRRKHDIGQ